jgi:hypothetical protein
LLCPTGEGIKCKKAKEWNVPIVGFDWLTQIASNVAEDVMTMRGDIVESSVRVERSMEALKIDESGNVSIPHISSSGSPVGNFISSSLQLISSESLSRNPSPTRSPQRRPLPETVYNRPISPFKDGKKTPQGSLTPRKPATISRQEAGSVIQRVPSSASPSPLAELKELNGISGGTSDENPTRLPFRSAFAKNLTKNIGAVIGAKRPAEDQGDLPFSASTNSSDGPRKRPRRPQAVRAKVRR